MDNIGIALIREWESFYVIVGSASAGLTGLMFVVITLIPERRARAASADDGVATFSTPTVVHFCAALLIAAIMSVPWSTTLPAATAIALTGAAGVVYGVIVLLRMRRVVDYAPVLEDWIWHTLLPFAAHAALLIGGLALLVDPRGALFGVGAGSLLLLFVGIHNAWDTVTYLTLHPSGDPE